jgi:hypothetical protein
VNKPQPLILLIVFLLAAHSIKFAQAPFVAHEQASLPDLHVSDVYIKKSNVPLAVAELAYYYKVPIGIEVSPDDDLLKDRNIVVQMESGTVRDLLNAIMIQHPLYTWEVEDEVINVFPSVNREPILKALLETRLKTFSVAPGTDRFTFRESVTEDPEVRGTLAAFGVEADNEVFLSRDISTLGHSFSLSISGATVRTILNLVIRESETKFWIVNRAGEGKQYLLLNL